MKKTLLATAIAIACGISGQAFANPTNNGSDGTTSSTTGTQTAPPPSSQSGPAPPAGDRGTVAAAGGRRRGGFDPRQRSRAKRVSSAHRPVTGCPNRSHCGPVGCRDLIQLESA